MWLFSTKQYSECVLRSLVLSGLVMLNAQSAYMVANPQPVKTNKSMLVLLEKNGITTYLETCLLSAYTLLSAYFLPFRVNGACTY